MAILVDYAVRLGCSVDFFLKRCFLSPFMKTTFVETNGTASLRYDRITENWRNLEKSSGKTSKLRAAEHEPLYLRLL